MAHCGTSLVGSFIWSLTFTDIFSQWTENRAVWNKEATDVLAQVKGLKQGVAFDCRASTWTTVRNSSPTISGAICSIAPGPSR